MKKCALAVGLFLLLCAIAPGQDEKLEAGEYTSRGMTAYSAGDYVLAIESFKNAFSLRPDYSALAYNISCCYALLGEADSAIVWLEKTFELGSFLFIDDEDLASLQANPRYRDLVQKAEQKIDELKDREWEPVVKVPDQYSGDKEYPVVIGLHGFGTNPIDFAKSLGSAVVDAGYVFCCPYGPFIRGTTAFGWGDCIDAEKRILKSVQYLTKEYNIDDKRVILLGFSEGGGMALCTGFRNPEIFAGIISVAGYYDEVLNEYLEDESLTSMPTYMMIGENDYGVKSNRMAEGLMKDHGLIVNLVVYEGVGHAFPAIEYLTPWAGRPAWWPCRQCRGSHCQPWKLSHPQG